MKTVFEEMRIRRKEAGIIGLEIEVEGKRLPTPPAYWRREVDGSLKAEESAEYVLARPALDEDELMAALKHLNDCYNENKSKVHDSVRAGVHVHINCQDLTIKQLYTFICLYLVLENVLVRFCGQYREGNLFCLRASDAEYLLTELKEAILTGHHREYLWQDNLRYASINVKALGDYGSLEFRAMRGTRDLTLIGNWALLLNHLKTASKAFSDPVEVIQRFSVETPQTFIQNVLGPFESMVRVKPESEYVKMLYEGMRNAQDIAYVTDWTKYGLVKTIGGLDFLLDENPDEPHGDY